MPSNRVSLMWKMVALTIVLGNANIYAAENEETHEISISTRSMNNVEILIKADEEIASVRYDREKNIWLARFFQKEIWKPINYVPEKIGKNGDIPAYRQKGSRMADGCTDHFYILTDQNYAIDIQAWCYDARLKPFVHSFKLPEGVNSIRAKTNESWATR